MTTSTPIGEYAVIGNTATAALVSRAGSIDWACLPRYDSPACFAALLGTPTHGRWFLGPEGTDVSTTRRYLPGTPVLETLHETPGGAVRVTDFFSPDPSRLALVRIVEGLRGSVDVTHEWRVRLDHGAVLPWVQHHEGHLRATGGPDSVSLWGERLPRATRDDDGPCHRDVLTVRAGERETFVLRWVHSWHDPEPPRPAEDLRRDAIAVGEAWSARCRYDGPHPEAVLRSVLTLRLLTHAETGGIVAAATTSLPETVGGERNWDYRFCWLRDAALTLEALLGTGHAHEAELWRRWLVRAIAGDPDDVQIMYGVDGRRRLPETTLDHLPGWCDSRPVRVGNGAFTQRQSDIFGEVMLALEHAREHGVGETAASWDLQRMLVDRLCETWREPDNGVWEIRGPARVFTHSRVMVWAAFDCAVRAVEQHGLSGDVDRWRREREAVRREVLERGFDTTRGTFRQHQDTDEVDASLLTLPLVGFLPGDDERVLGTVRAVREDLTHHGLLLRYRTDSGVDGLSGEENPFLACSFWLVEALALGGSVDEAEELFDRLVGLTNDVGLLAEEYDPVEGRQIGNFPQAFSHLTLVRAGLTIQRARAGHRSLR